MSTASLEARVKTSRAAVIKAPGAEAIIEKREIRFGEDHQVLLKVQACGVCHSDSFAFNGTFPGLKYPIVPGHEIVGIVEDVGSKVERLKKGDRVGVGWAAGYCGHCESCRSGDFVACQKPEVPGITCDGGYAEYAVFPEEACAIIPEQLSSAEAAPLLCAGVTTFNALRHSVARPGDVVAVLGLGGLGHLGVQFAYKMGFHTVAIARGDEKASFAQKLGAAQYINSEKQNAAEELNKLGGAKVVLATATSSKAMSALVDGLGVGGQLLIVGADMEPLNINPIQLIMARRSVTGWPSGTAKDSEDCLRFSALTGVRPMIEKFPFEKAREAYDRMMSGKAKFRAVIEFGT
jgi:D-arabinose 1-dehydrogenase-like Zn-dependent alcohol dehydrogenase